MSTLAVTFFSTALAQTLGAPRPHHDTQCRTSWDCDGDGVYCYLGNPNYCAHGSGIGSLCREQSACGWLGYGDNARKMYCAGGSCVDPWHNHHEQPVFGRRLESLEDVEAAIQMVEGDLEIQGATTEQRRADESLGAPRPNPNSNHGQWNKPGCNDSWDCEGDSVYCYPGLLRNWCFPGNGIGSICQSDSSCGWVGFGDHAHKLTCSRGDMRRLGSVVGTPRPRPGSSAGTCIRWNGY